MKIKIVAGIIAFIITIGMWYHQEISAPRDLIVHHELYVNDHYAFIKPPSSDLIEIFTDDGINVKICKGGLNNCQEIKMK